MESFYWVCILGTKWDDDDIEEQYKNQGGKPRDHTVVRFSERKDRNPCGGNFSLIPPLDQNKKTPGLKQCECSVCGQVFMHHSSLNRHMKYHIEHKPQDFKKYDQGLYNTYKCKECGKVYKYYSSLQRHKRTHTGEKLCEFQQCGKSFSNHSSRFPNT